MKSLIIILTALSFGAALEAAEAGKCISRSGWNGKSMFVYHVPAAAYQAQTGAAKAYYGETSLVPYNAYLALKGADNIVSTWVPSVTDTLAKDWCVVEFGEAPEAAKSEPAVLTLVPECPIDCEIKKVKQLRRDADELVQRLKDLPGTRETSLAKTKLQEGIMWMGMELKRISDATGIGENPYPNSMNPGNTVIDPTADDLKL